ncbi:aldo/keto reductase [Salinarimonas ramus]|uniref:Aldo/keto reductase n=1 Tax=Salinarimonas ramus TaxID=690164 RepID=A0A917QBF9_9HYPH|nr:aldo/keto reductase [Salinarimonas ramus]GGK40507.1 aldo/keto reductase [Salinarimonas ramus]
MSNPATHNATTIDVAGHRVPRIGMGTWAVAGPFFAGDEPLGYAGVEDEASIAALQAAYDAGVRFFDTADVYGAGHSEELVGRALKGRSDAVIATKLGLAFDPATKQVLGPMSDPAAVVPAIEASLRRLGRDSVPLVFFHLNSMPVADAEPYLDGLETARARGLIERFGWSTDFPESARAGARREGFVAVQHCMNVFYSAPTMMGVVAEHGLVSVNRSPLAMGLLTGKYGADTAMPDDDIRRNSYGWMDWFKDGKVAPEHLETLGKVREILTVGGRTLAQGALSWLLAHSPHALPIPGARNAKQAEENAGAIAHGPLPESAMREIEALVPRVPDGEPRER